jgi:hypothetical protein
VGLGLFTLGSIVRHWRSADVVSSSACAYMALMVLVGVPVVALAEDRCFLLESGAVLPEPLDMEWAWIQSENERLGVLGEQATRRYMAAEQAPPGPRRDADLEDARRGMAHFLARSQAWLLRQEQWGKALERCKQIEPMR